MKLKQSGTWLTDADKAKQREKPSDDLTVSELREMAKAKEIEGYTKMTKSELIAALEA